MRNAVIAILLLAATLSASGQDFNTHWVYAPQADSTSHVWFRRAYICGSRPWQATVTVTTTGYFKLYVNECNVGTALFYPMRENGGNDAIATTLDITPYLRADTNVVALLFAPTAPSAEHRQIAVSVFGSYADGHIFSHTTDESWLCRRANSHLTADGGEAIDGRATDPTWKAATTAHPARWMPAALCHEAADGQTSTVTAVAPYATTALHATGIIGYSQDALGKSQSCIQLDTAVYGFPRITFREARRGETVSLGSLTYTCNGKIDEQAYPLFRMDTWRTIQVTGGQRFKASAVVGIEMIAVSGQQDSGF